MRGSTRKINRLQLRRYSWLDNHPIGKEYDEKHSLHRSSKRILETEKPMWNWTFEKFLSFDYSGLHVIENGHPVGRDFCCLLEVNDLFRAGERRFVGDGDPFPVD